MMEVVMELVSEVVDKKVDKKVEEDVDEKGLLFAATQTNGTSSTLTEPPPYAAHSASYT